MEQRGLVWVFCHLASFSLSAGISATVSTVTVCFPLGIKLARNVTRHGKQRHIGLVKSTKALLETLYRFFNNSEC